MHWYDGCSVARVLLLGRPILFVLLLTISTSPPSIWCSLLLVLVWDFGFRISELAKLIISPKEEKGFKPEADIDKIIQGVSFLNSVPQV